METDDESSLAGGQKENGKSAKGGKRIEIIDALRGLAVSLMVVHHFLYNLAAFLGAPWWLYSNPVFDVLQAIFIGVFVFLSGVSSRFSHSNIRRGAIALALAAGITAVTYAMEMTIWFGILHLLGSCMLFFGLTKRLWDKVPRMAMPLALVPLIAASAYARANVALTSGTLRVRNVLSVLGWRQPGRFDPKLLPWQHGFVFGSFDYQPLLPWVFVFLLGTWAGLYIRERRLPGWFYDFKVPAFPKIGRKALLVYVLHQPIMYGIMMGVLALMGRSAA